MPNYNGSKARQRWLGVGVGFAETFGVQCDVRKGRARRATTKAICSILSVQSLSEETLNLTLPWFAWLKIDRLSLLLCYVSRLAVHCYWCRYR